MNRTQKAAMVSLSAFALAVAVLGYLLVRILVLRSLPQSFLGKAWPMLAFAALAVWWVAMFRKQQSLAEPEADERDSQIVRWAALIGFVATWVLLAVVTLVLGLVLGQTGTVPVYVLTFIHLGLFVAVMLVYFVVVLVQYGRTGKGALE
jgi:hypothetical protein